VNLPAGDFVVNLTKPDGSPDKQPIKVAKGVPASVSPVFEAVSANEIVKSSN